DRDAEALREHRAEGLYLHLAEAGQRRDALAEIGAVGGFRPEAGRVAAVFLRDGRRELADAPSHVAGEAVDGRLLAEDRLEIGLRNGGGLERAEPLLQPERAEEGLLDGDLLVERESDEEREGIVREQAVCFVVLREPK